MRILKLVGWIGVVIALGVASVRGLWFAWTTHAILVPRGGGGSAALEREPGLFWFCVAMYTLIALAAPFATLAAVGDLRAHLRSRRAA